MNHLKEWFNDNIEFDDNIIDSQDLHIAGARLGFRNRKIYVELTEPPNDLHIGESVIASRINKWKGTYNQIYAYHWNTICRKNNIQCNWVPDDICHTNEKLLNNNYPEFEYLFVNSQPFSGQVDNDGGWDKIVNKMDVLARKLPCITTRKVAGVPCTTEIAPSLWQIGQLATKCKRLVGINTAPWVASMSKYTLENVDKIVNYDTNWTFNYSFCKCVNTNTFEDFMGAI